MLLLRFCNSASLLRLPGKAYLLILLCFYRSRFLALRLQSIILSMKIKVAIPLFGTRISPHFTYADTALLVDIDNGSIGQSREIALGPSEELQRIQYLKSLAIDTLICGGISRVAESMFAGQGVEVISWVAGEARDALERFAGKGLVSGTCLCAGKRRCRRKEPSDSSGVKRENRPGRRSLDRR